jgi:hypothetical protein
MAAVGGLLAARPFRGLASTPLNVSGASRISKLQPGGLFLVHTDLHNHSLISGDAAGDPVDALVQMAGGGIDVACMTEHAISGKGHGELTCPGHEQGGCHTIEGINDSDWARMAEIADGGYQPGSFVSFRGFEWSTPTVGHLNVWFSSEYTDALRQHALLTPTAAAEIDRVAPVPSEIVDNFEQAPELATMRHFYEWLASAPDRELFGGGNDGIACFNHPNEFGNFESFAYEPAVASRIVSLEALNADRDFFWFGAEDGVPNPLNASLNAGWRVGFTGVSDEHSTQFARPGMARGGLWIPATSLAGSLTREAVQAALPSRRTFATFEAGLRLDATANGVPMGSIVSHQAGPVLVQLDIDRGVDWEGRRLLVEVIRPGATAPTLAATIEVAVPEATGDPIAFPVEVDTADGTWMFLRITDPEGRAPHPLATEPYASHGGVVAYASPWFFQPS